MKFRPLHDRVVVKRIDAEEKSSGGIIIPDTAKEKPSQGEVTAVGPGGRDEAGKLIPIDVKVGDRVLFGKWSGTEVKIDGQELLTDPQSSWTPAYIATLLTGRRYSLRLRALLKFLVTTGRVSARVWSTKMSNLKLSASIDKLRTLEVCSCQPI